MADLGYPQELQQEPVDLVGGVDRDPVVDPLEAFVAPGALHVACGEGHLGFGEGGVVGRPDAEGGAGDRGEVEAGGVVGGEPGGVVVGPVPVEAGGQGAGAGEVGELAVQVGVLAGAGAGPDTAAVQGPVVGGQDLLGHAGEQEPQHVPGQPALGQAGRDPGQGVADRQRDQALDPLGGEHGDPPGYGGAPVVAHHRGPRHAEGVEQAGDVADQGAELVGLDLG